MRLGLIFLEKSDCRHYCPVSSGHIIQVFGSYKWDRKGSVFDDVMAGGGREDGERKRQVGGGKFPADLSRCPKPGSNRHVFKGHWILSPTRLPIPPFGQ